jgi:hypothetical protein
MAEGKHGPWRWVEINKNGDSSNLHAVSRCGEKAWEAGEARQLGHVPFPVL